MSTKRSTDTESSEPILSVISHLIFFSLNEVGTSDVSTVFSFLKYFFGNFTYFENIILSVSIEVTFWLPFRFLMLIEILTPGISSSFSIPSNVPWLLESRRADVFTLFVSCSALILPTIVAAFLISVAFYGSKLFISFLFADVFWLLTLWQCSPDKPSYSWMFLLYKLKSYLHSTHRRLHSS